MGLCKCKMKRMKAEKIQGMYRAYWGKPGELQVECSVFMGRRKGMGKG